jgi:hypothetical protein
MRSAASGASAPIDPRLLGVCKLIVSLQDERHRADYDLSTPFSRTETVRRITDSESAITTLRSLEPTGETLIFFLGALFGDSLTKNQ